MKNQLPVKVFSAHPGSFATQDHLAEVQLNSYEWFKKDGLKELFKEVSPIKDYTGKEYEVHFVDYYFDEPKYDENQSRLKDLTYEASLRVKVKLINKKLNDEKIQEVYFGDFPVMTDRGTFIVNGVERVVISQLIRSPGVYFTANVWRGKKLFGAKIIPGRGVWIEFETDSDGFIGIKIDRKRKVAATDILRIFGIDDFSTLLKDVDTGAIKYIETTLKKSETKTLDESYIEVYKRVRPGDLATIENMKSLIDSIFFRTDRYDLSDVGWFKTMSRLGLKEKATDKLLNSNILIAILKEIIRLNNDQSSEPDDIDHLGNRRVKAVGELIQSKMRIGLARMRRIIQDRMSTISDDTISPLQIVNSKPLISVIREFFSSSQLSQFMDQVNPLSEVEHKRRISALGPGGGLNKDRAGFEVRDVHQSHYGRICPIQTPEGSSIGLINYFASFIKINEFGFLETPYIVVKHAKMTGELVWLDALEEEKEKIAHAGINIDFNTGKILDEIVGARIFGEPGTCSKEEITLIDVAPRQAFSIGTSLVPFLEHTDANRAGMGANMQRQAVVSVKARAPYVGTGMEKKVARDSGYLLIAPEDGTIESVDSAQITLKTKSEIKKFDLIKFKRSNQFTCISQKPKVFKGDKVKKGDVLADGPSIENGVLALGQNLTVAFLSWEGANHEDAIVLSERVVENDLFTSIHIEEYECDVRDTKLGPEMTTPDIPNVSEEKLKNLDEDGIIRIGAEVKAGDILVGKISPKGESELTSEERLLRAIFGEKARDVKDTSLVLPHGKTGRIVNIKIKSREFSDKLEPGIIKRIQVEIAQLRKIQAGDKLSGRHGNKGVISQVRPVEDMPYLSDGTPVDIILNPLGIVSRMNLGQMFEVHLGMAAKKLGYRAETPALSGATEEEIKTELRKAGFSDTGKFTLYDGRTGMPFAQPVTVGLIYMLKLNHLVEDKIHMRSIGPYSLITQQPLGGKAQFGGQRFGEMEVWALEGYGAANILQEMLTTKSDDILGRSSAYESIIRGQEIKTPNIPASFNVLVNELKSLAFDIELVKSDDNESEEPLKDQK